MVEEEQQAKAQLAKRRQLLINSPKPPRQSDIALDGKSICDAQNAYWKGREELSEAWNSKYQELPDAVSMAWDLYHDAEGDSEMRLRDRTPTVHDLPDDLTEVENGRAHPEYQKFQRYSAAILQQLERLEANLENALNPPAGSRPPLKAWSLDEIDENDGSVWPVPRFIPHGLTFVYGLPKSGKSLWMQKLSACIAGGVPFDGIEELEHGRVLYITRDIGASRQEVKKRLMKILPHLGLSEDALDGKLILTDDPFHLNDPASVDNLLAYNPGRFVLVVIDSLFRCVGGSLSQDVVASDAVEAIDRISRATGAAVVAIHHEPRSGEHLFGSVMLDAAYDAKIHVERGKDRNSVVVTVQELKNAPVPDKPFIYRIEEEYLAAVAGAESVTTPKLASSRHREMLALLPAGWFTRKEGRKLAEPLLTGAEEARRKQWQRAVAAMKASGEIEVSTKA
jgi:AAA domain